MSVYGSGEVLYSGIALRLAIAIPPGLHLADSDIGCLYTLPSRRVVSEPG